MMLGAIKVYQSEYTRTTFEDGRPCLFQLVRVPKLQVRPLTFVTTQRDPIAGSEPVVLVHPSRWDAFWMAVNQPDVFAHPEVQELLGLAMTTHESKGERDSRASCG